MHASAEKRFVASTVCAVAGCKTVTFRAWRLRNNLFPETQGSKQWNLFSIVDICIARLVVVLTRLGLDAADAVLFAQNSPRLSLTSLLAGDEDGIGPVFGFFREENNKPIYLVWGDGKGSVAELMERAQGAATLIDIRVIVGHVLKELRALQPESIASKQETLAIVADAFADALDPGKEPPSRSKRPSARGRK